MTDIDPDLGPMGRVEWEIPVVLSGQVRYNKHNQMMPVGGGNDPAADGHIVFQDAEWKRSGGHVGDEM
ncbi:MAG: hypothetical protein LBR71_01350, partial [Synergistaceae bacterium]|nr:hypothetical protein [Synergistaceae bacterium]